MNIINTTWRSRFSGDRGCGDDARDAADDGDGGRNTVGRDDILSLMRSVKSDDTPVCVCVCLYQEREDGYSIYRTNIGRGWARSKTVFVVPGKVFDCLFHESTGCLGFYIDGRIFGIYEHMSNSIIWTSTGVLLISE